VAVEAAQRAAVIVREHLGRLSAGDVSRKEGLEFVTFVDRASERAIIDTIRARFPQDAIFAEESSREAGARRWLIDPLDGTTNFIHSYPMFCVSIGLESEGEMVLGVVLDIVRDELFLARRGAGATVNGKAIRTSEVTLPADALLATGFPFRARARLKTYMECFAALLEQVHDMRRCGSAALDLAHVACGRLDGFWEVSLKPWDMAAGSLLVSEAGGRVSDFHGAGGFLTSGDIIASNGGGLHEVVIEAVRPLRRP
jgi:myo-inositol-1(or 4)-monophosphatase